MAEPTWSQADVFPVIANAIESLHADGGGWATHDRIVSHLLNSADGAAQIRQALESSDTDRTAEWLAHNMVAWFSQRITVGDSDWAVRFVREKIDGKRAYQPTAKVMGTLET